MLVKQAIEYHDQDVLLEGYYVYDDAITTKRPLVLIAHDWSGRTEFTHKKAEKLAELGYVGFALDMYGKGKVGNTTEEKSALMKPLMEDRNILQRRINAALTTAKQLEKVDAQQVAAIGFCFGGACVLDLMRSGAVLKGVVSFHGILSSPPHHKQVFSDTKVLVLHGFDDPMVSPDDVLAFEKEMTAAKIDWQVHIYSNTMHAFTNPKANDAAFGTVYNNCSDKRSWVAMKDFFKEVFSQ